VLDPERDQQRGEREVRDEVAIAADLDGGTVAREVELGDREQDHEHRQVEQERAEPRDLHPGAGAPARGGGLRDGPRRRRASERDSGGDPGQREARQVQEFGHGAGHGAEGLEAARPGQHGAEEVGGLLDRRGPRARRADRRELRREEALHLAVRREGERDERRYAKREARQRPAQVGESPARAADDEVGRREAGEQRGGAEVEEQGEARQRAESEEPARRGSAAVEAQEQRVRRDLEDQVLEVVPLREHRELRQRRRSEREQEHAEHGRPSRRVTVEDPGHQEEASEAEEDGHELEDEVGGPEQGVQRRREEARDEVAAAVVVVEVEGDPAPPLARHPRQAADVRDLEARDRDRVEAEVQHGGAEREVD
jgi:hypothetical protein